MFLFLSSASGAYLKHFTPELRALSSRCGLDVPLSSLGPAVIVFQETTHTQLLGHGRGRKCMSSVYFKRSNCVVYVIFLAIFFLACRFQGSRPFRHAAPEAFPRSKLGDTSLQLSAVRRNPDHHPPHRLQGAAGGCQAASEEHSHTLPPPAGDCFSCSGSKWFGAFVFIKARRTLKNFREKKISL